MDLNQMQTLAETTRQHIHFGNNILFPRALEFEKGN